MPNVIGGNQPMNPRVPISLCRDATGERGHCRHLERPRPGEVSQVSQLPYSFQRSESFQDASRTGEAAGG